jgi:chaperonin cofactor prefoldin
MGNGQGLKQQWGVDDPAKAGSDKQSQQFQAAFQKEQGAINGFLQYTSANADPAAHDPLEKRRDALYPAFQSALAQIDRADPAKAKDAIDKVLADAKALGTDAGNLKKAAEKALNDWQARVAKYDAAVHQVEELETWGDPKAAALRALVDGIRAQTNQRKYAGASAIVDQLLPKLKPLYDEYQKQKAAKPQYEQALAEQGARLDALKAADRPSQPMTAKSGEADAALGQARSKADAKDFVGGLEQIKAVKTAADALDKLAKDPQRAKFLAGRPAAEELISGSLDTSFKSLEADRNAVLELRDHVDPNADAGDYAGANKALTDLQAKATAYKKKVEGLQKQKQAYDEALAALQPKLTEASQSKYPKLDPMQQDMITVQGQMETAAQNEDFVQALKALKDLSVKVDAYAKALAELEQQKQAYDRALADLQPKLTAASECRYPKLTPLQEDLVAVQKQMETAAAAEDFVKALGLLKDLSSKLDTYAKELAQLDQQKKEYEGALAPANAKVANVLKTQFLDLAAKQDEITKLQQQAAALAQAGDYDKAMPVVKDMATKADAYLAAAAKEVEPPILGSAQDERSQALLKKMSAADQKAVAKIMDDAKSEPEKQFILKGLAAGHSAKELQDFAKKIQGKDATWMRDNLSLTGSSTGKGVKQQWSTACNATMVEAVHGQMDPIYALKMHEDNPDLDQADNSDGTKKNPKLAADQKSMLTSNYKGGSGGVAVSIAGRKRSRAARWQQLSAAQGCGTEQTRRTAPSGAPGLPQRPPPASVRFPRDHCPLASDRRRELQFPLPYVR